MSTEPQEESKNVSAPEAPAQANSSTSEAAAAPPAPPAAARRDDDDDGPQPGNVAPPPEDYDDEDEGPAPGNERFPGARPATPAQARPEGTGKRRRRRKKKGDRPHGPDAAAQQQPAPAPEGGEAAPAPAEGSAPPAPVKTGEPPRRDPAGRHGPPPHPGRDKRPRPQRPDRERPAFNVGDVTFGKIVEITDDAVFVDLSGKGRAIFDRAELLLPEEGPEPHEPEPHDDEHDDASAEAAPPAEGTEAVATEATAEEAAAPAPATVAAEGGEAPAAEAATPAEPEAQAPSAEAPQAEAPEAAHEGEKAEAAEEAAPAAADATAKPATKKPEPKKPEPPPLLPPVLLEVGAYFVGVVHNDGGRGGLVVLTRHPRRGSKAKPAVAQAFKDKTVVYGLVTGVIKGGVEADIDGLRAFVPASHMDLRLGADLSSSVGKRLEFVVTQYAKRGRDVVLSRKPMLEAQHRATRDAAISKLSVGAVMDGVVRSVVPFGAFIDLGEVEGLVPLSEMSHNRADGPSDVFKPGETTQVRVIKIDDKGKVWLSRKQAVPDPWQEVAKKYAVGTRHQARVVRLQPFGAFVELEPGIDGLIHAADLVFPDKGHMKRIEHPEEIVKIGDEFEVVVAHTDAAAHKIGLHPALLGEAANEPHQRVQQYKMVKAAVVATEAGGLVVRVLGATGRNARGYIPSPATGTPRGTELRKVFSIGQKLEAKVMELDPKRGEVKLSIKALNDQAERDAFQQYRAQVNKEARFTLGDLLKKATEKS